MDIRKWKALKATLATLAIFLLSVYAIHSGGDPTSIAWLGLVVFALVNGIELAELVAVWSDARNSTRDSTKTNQDSK